MGSLPTGVVFSCGHIVILYFLLQVSYLELSKGFHTDAVTSKASSNQRAIACCHSTSVCSEGTIEVEVIKMPLVFFKFPIPLEQTYHHMASIKDSKIGSLTLLDFVPSDKSFSTSGTLTALSLIAGQCQEGRVRIRGEKELSPKMEKLIDKIVQTWCSNINIYTHNCQHFCEHVKEKVRENSLHV